MYRMPFTEMFRDGNGQGTYTNGRTKSTSSSFSGRKSKAKNSKVSRTSRRQQFGMFDSIVRLFILFSSSFCASFRNFWKNAVAIVQPYTHHLPPVQHQPIDQMTLTRSSIYSLKTLKKSFHKIFISNSIMI